MKRERERHGAGQGTSEMKRLSRARYHKVVKGKPEWQQDSQGAGVVRQQSQHTKPVLELGGMDHEEAGEERGLPALCRCQPLFPEPAGITQQEVDEATK